MREQILTGNLQAGDVILLGEEETEALRVVVDLVHTVQLQVEEALVASLEGLVSRRSHD